MRARSRSAASSRASATTATSGFEGCRARPRVGTYLHGPLLPRNPWLADWLLAQAVAHATGGEPPVFEPLDDRLEAEAHAVSAARARARGGRFWSDPPGVARPFRRAAPPGQRCRPTAPTAAEVYGRVARLPAGQEALDRRVEDDLLELPHREQPVAADGRVRAR